MRKQKMSIIIKRALTIIIFNLIVFAQDIDWINKTITVDGGAYGKNKLMAKRGAETDARRNLIEALKEIRVDSRTTMRDMEVEEDIVVTEASGFIRQAWIDDSSIKYEREDEKWMCSISMTMPLLGEYSQVLLQATSKRPSEAKTPVYKPAATPPPPKEPYTGLIVDLRGNRVVPSMIPKIVTEEGAVVYGMSIVSRQYATNMGVVGYIKKIDNPISMTRVGENPLVVKAKGTTGATPSDALVSSKDADLISSLETNLLKECKVAFLID
ncbi:MAG: hypothetical protein HN815_07130 [Candidatus Marinimicrobia bacterium]|mgnify:FL=1|nr:hypothetical protein [Candidatus Neomarinimicrobiota bacterium]MBT7373747.1 hypothetical protein [Candidatus Neomarinimicrobiota bacterium]